MYGKSLKLALPRHVVITLLVLFSVVHKNPATMLAETREVDDLIKGKTAVKSMVYDPTRTTTSIFNISEGSPLRIILSREQKGHCEMFFMHFTDLSISKGGKNNRTMIVCVSQLHEKFLREKCQWVNSNVSLKIDQGNLYGMPKDCGPWYLTVLMTSNSTTSNTTELAVVVSEPYDPLVFRWFRVITNLAFIPGIILAFKRGFYAEGIVYFLNFALSTVYHCCEAELHCFKGYNRLHVSDMYSSDLSITVTIWAMSGVRAPLKYIIYLTIAILYQFAVGETMDIHYHFFLNLTFAGLPLCYFFYTNIYRSIKLRHCFPHMKRWAFHYIPGFMLGGTGALINIVFTESDNYYWVHCIWHLTIMLSVAFLLPAEEDEDERAWYRELYEEKSSYTRLI